MLIVLLILTLIPIIGLSCVQQSPYTPAGASPASNGKLIILESQLTTNKNGNLEVVGKAENIYGSNISHAYVRVKFLDSAGNLLNNGLATVNDLAAGQTWSFEVIYPGSDSSQVATYQIAVETIVV